MRSGRNRLRMVIQRKELAASIHKRRMTIKVDVGFVKSTEYRKKFENLDENENTQKAIWQKARDILVHRNGTNKEDMYLISVIDGKIKGKALLQKKII